MIRQFSNINDMVVISRWTNSRKQTEMIKQTPILIRLRSINIFLFIVVKLLI